SDTKIFGALKVAVNDEGLESTIARRGMNITLDEGVNFLILFPDRDASRMESNEASIVGRLSYGDSSFLLTGDAPISTEHVLLSYKDSLGSDVLKAGHHGSRTSTSPAFVNVVSPTYAVISAGKDNSYGHPHKEVLDRLMEAGISILSTIEKGTIIFEVSHTEITPK
ncbi:MAG: MBL fold metallo-hydrolase, partial [Patescibacteria group bacterium]